MLGLSWLFIWWSGSGDTGIHGDCTVEFGVCGQEGTGTVPPVVEVEGSVHRRRYRPIPKKILHPPVIVWPEIEKRPRSISGRGGAAFAVTGSHAEGSYQLRIKGNATVQYLPLLVEAQGRYIPKSVIGKATSETFGIQTVGHGTYDRTKLDRLEEDEVLELLSVSLFEIPDQLWLDSEVLLEEEFIVEALIPFLLESSQ